MTIDLDSKNLNWKSRIKAIQSWYKSIIESGSIRLPKLNLRWCDYWMNRNEKKKIFTRLWLYLLCVISIMPFTSKMDNHFSNLSTYFSSFQKLQLVKKMMLRLFPECINPKLHVSWYVDFPNSIFPAKNDCNFHPLDCGRSGIHPLGVGGSTHHSRLGLLGNWCGPD